MLRGSVCGECMLPRAASSNTDDSRWGGVDHNSAEHLRRCRELREEETCTSAGKSKPFTMRAWSLRQWTACIHGARSVAIKLLISVVALFALCYDSWSVYSRHLGLVEEPISRHRRATELTVLPNHLAINLA